MLVTGALRALRQPGHAPPYWTLRACSNAPCEIPHIFLTALARFAQWTGFYYARVNALAHSGALTILTGMTTAMCISPGASTPAARDLVRYTQILNPV